jgi:hypothetical protein
MADPVRRAVGNAGDDHAAIAVPDDYASVRSLPLQQVHDVVDMGVEINPRVKQVGMLAIPGSEGA